MKLSTELPEMDTIVSTLRDYFDEERIEQEAEYVGFIKKPRKLTGMSFFCICIMQGFGCSLGVMCGALKGFSISLCEQSLNERFSKSAVAFMKRLFSQMLRIELSKSVQMDFLSRFSGVFIQDSTVINLPNEMSGMFKGTGGSAGKSSVKIDFQMDMQGTACQMDIRGGTSSDNTQAVKNPQNGALYIRDLGYFNIDFFSLIIKAGAYFLSRLKSKTAIYEDIGGKIQLNAYNLAKDLKVNATLYIPVFIGTRKLVPAFLIIQKLPPEVVAVKIEKAKKSHKQRMTKITKQHLEWCEFNGYLTNIPPTWFSAETVMQIYGIRWQIEIMFKVWKSIFKIGDIGKMTANRVLCILYGRLIWILLQMKIFRVFKKNVYGVSRKEISELRAFKQMNEYKSEFKTAITSGVTDHWRRLIEFLFQLIQDLAMKKNRRHKIAPLYNLNFQSITN